jgi:DNA mismatch repair protein MutL
MGESTEFTQRISSPMEDTKAFEQKASIPMGISTGYTSKGSDSLEKNINYSEKTYGTTGKNTDTRENKAIPLERRINFEDKPSTPVYAPINKGIAKFEPLAIVGQIHFTYIVAEGMGDMYLIDQHAAHERIYYENFMAEYKASSIQSQNLLVPIVIELSLGNKQQVFDNMELFSKIGYEIDDFGGNSIALRCVPLIYGNPDNIELFNEIMGTLDTKTKDLFHVIDKVIYTMACKSAIKAGDKLNYREMTELIDKLRYCENPFNCPHGRPTIIKMSYVEMEKKFKRIQ